MALCCQWMVVERPFSRNDIIAKEELSFTPWAPVDVVPRHLEC